MSSFLACKILHFCKPCIGCRVIVTSGLACCNLLSRWISSTNKTVCLLVTVDPSVPDCLLIACLISAIPHETAERGTKWYFCDPAGKESKNICAILKSPPFLSLYLYLLISMSKYFFITPDI